MNIKTKRKDLINYILTYAGDEIETKEDYKQLVMMNKRELLNNVKSIKQYYKNN